MRIAITADPELPIPPVLYGGIERIINMLISCYTKQGHEITLFAHRDSKVECELIAYPGISQSTSSFITNCSTINKNIITRNFDIVHSFGRLAYLAPILPFGIPKLMSYQREPTISQIKKAMIIVKKNTLFFSGCSNYITNQIKPFALAKTVYNGVSTQTFQVNYTLQPNAPLAFLGRIEPVKGTHLAVEIALKAGKKLIIAGNVPIGFQGYFNKQIKPFLGNQISYIGSIDDPEKNHLLQNTLALLMPVQWNEPFGIVMIEAMACGTPILGFNRGAIPEVVEHAKTGFVGETMDELIASVQKVGLLDRNTIRETMEKRFSASVIAENYLALYQKIISKRSI